MVKLSNYFDFLGNIMYRGVGAYSLLKPKIMTVAITNKCNSRCFMCRIWEKKQRMRELTYSDWKKILSESRLLKEICLLNLTGGEPFLRKDIVKLTKLFVKEMPKLEEIRFATNGSLTKKIVKDLKEIVKLPCRFNLKVSIDGLQKTHDKIRGVKNSFDMADKTIDELIKLRNKHKNLDLAVSCTIIPQNYREILDVYEYYKKKDMDFIYKIANYTPAFANKEIDINLSAEQKKSIAQNLKEIYSKEGENIKNRKRNFRKIKKIAYLIFLRELIKFVEDPKNFYVPCHSMFSAFFLESDGKLYSCGNLYSLAGDLRKEKFDDMWKKDELKKIRKYIKDGKCKCFTSCDTIPSILLSNSFEIARRFLA